MFNPTKISLLVLSSLFFLISLFNIFQPKRQTISEKENRELSSFPELSVKSVSNGNFFANIDTFIADTFLCRDVLIETYEKINRCKSIDIFVKNEDKFIYVAANENAKIMNDKNDNKLSDNSMNIIFSSVGVGTFSNIQTLTSSFSNISKNNQEILDVQDKKANDNEANDEEKMEYVPGGYILYKGIPYCVAGDASKKSMPFFKTVELYSKLFLESKVSIVLAPQSSILITDPNVNKHILNQTEYIDNIYKQCSDDIHKINPCNSLLEHQNEQIYFHYDHHWTQRGAYYAYKDFCISNNIEPVALDSLEEIKVTDSWHGSTYKFTGDERFKDGTDELYVYIPSKTHTMTYVTQTGTLKNSNCCIDKNFRGYVAILNGDQPYTVITVPDNPQDKTCLVFKDSYGNAFIPFLCEHYGSIVVIDPRHLKVDMYEQLKSYNFTDIIFCTAIYEPGVPAFTKGLERIVASSIPKEK